MDGFFKREIFSLWGILGLFSMAFAVIFREGIVGGLSFAQIDESNGILSTVFVGNDEQ